jgi:hypothetical protein
LARQLLWRDGRNRAVETRQAVAINRDAEEKTLRNQVEENSRRPQNVMREDDGQEEMTDKKAN